MRWRRFLSRSYRPVAFWIVYPIVATSCSVRAEKSPAPEPQAELTPLSSELRQADELSHRFVAQGQNFGPATSRRMNEVLAELELLKRDSIEPIRRTPR